ncbi:GNAT family N-acetyltransferase [Kitasatospora viridis]|uniref:RimJ/RimL family protein N-acetyltransferase n=1 Tax=Kitasatospora viridis TaxID=281105 RepID=A0A561TTA4_9ACTN|nr:GNAT family protein [Kitasatospora viridis]TWF90335.1 RimJ/RimL family protein N-acetyltransferase [Kitasatospora viridis]
MTLPPLRLREITLDDWPAVHAWASLEQACRYQPWGPNTPEQTRAFVQAAVDARSRSPRSRYPYAVCLAGEVVGMGELHVRSHGHHQGEISYILHPRLWGHGLGTAIGRALLARGFQELALHRIHATCDPRNHASAGVLRRIGMTHEGRHRHTLLTRDGWRDSDVYSILEGDWPGPGGS